MTDFVPNLNQMQEPAPEKITLSQGPGRLLADARRRAGRSVSEIASCLYVSVNMINGIERDDFENLPPATFVRGYLRAYAIEVGIDPDEILKLHKRFTGEDGTSFSTPPRTLGSTVIPTAPSWLPIAIWWGGAIVILCILALTFSLWGKSTLKETKPALRDTPIETTVFPEGNSETNDEFNINTE